MRTRAGVVLIEDNKVALIERHRAGLDYFVFPGGGVHEGESPEQGAIREALEELGIQVAIKQKIAEIHFGRTSKHVIFWSKASVVSLGQELEESLQIQTQIILKRGYTFQSGCPLKNYFSTRMFILRN